MDRAGTIETRAQKIARINAFVASLVADGVTHYGTDADGTYQDHSFYNPNHNEMFVNAGQPGSYLKPEFKENPKRVQDMFYDLEEFKILAETLAANNIQLHIFSLSGKQAIADVFEVSGIEVPLENIHGVEESVRAIQDPDTGLWKSETKLKSEPQTLRSQQLLKDVEEKYGRDTGGGKPGMFRRTFGVTGDKTLASQGIKIFYPDDSKKEHVALRQAFPADVASGSLITYDNFASYDEVKKASSRTEMKDDPERPEYIIRTTVTDFAKAKAETGFKGERFAEATQHVQALTASRGGKVSDREFVPHPDTLVVKTETTIEDVEDLPLPDLPTAPNIAVSKSNIYDTVSPPSQEELDLKDLREALKTATSSFNPTDPAAAARSNATSVLKALRDRSTVEIAGPQSFFTSDGKPLDLYAVAAEAGNSELASELKRRGVEQTQEKYSSKEAVVAALAQHQEKTSEAQAIRATKAGAFRNFFTGENKRKEAAAAQIEDQAAGNLIATINNLAASGLYDVDTLIADYTSEAPAGPAKDKMLTALDSLKEFAQQKAAETSLPRSKSHESLNSRRMAWMSSGLPSEPSEEGPVMGVKLIQQPFYVNLEELQDGQRSSETDSSKDIAGSHTSLDTVATNTTVDSGYEAGEDPNIAFANAFEGAMAEYKIDAKQLKGRDHRFYTVTIQSDYANTPDTLVIVKVRYEENEQGISAPTGQVEVAVDPTIKEDGSAILRPKNMTPGKGYFPEGAEYKDLGSVDRRIIDTISSWAQHKYTPWEVAQSRPATPTGSAHVTAFQPGTHTKEQRITIPEGDARKESQSNVGKMRQQSEQQVPGGGVAVR